MNASVLLLDNLDSFSFNLADELARRAARVEVVRCTVPASEVLERARALPAPRLLVISPGPGSPDEAHCALEVVRRGGSLPLFGVCLGLQVMVVALGGEVGPAGELIHGQASPVLHDGGPPFEGLPSPFAAGRYHSLAAHRLPAGLAACARAGEVVMAVRGLGRPLLGVQFHPESILTPQGGTLLANALRWAERAAEGRS